MKETREGFLGRWSERKRRAATAAPSPDATSDDARLQGRTVVEQPVNGAIDASAPPVLNEVDGQSGEGSDTTSDDSTGGTADEEIAPLLSDADMPPLETLDAKSDISCFFNAGVSGALKRAALRHVFHLAEYNVRDGLDDYDDDYTNFEPLGDTITSDMKFHSARLERDRLAREAEERLLAEANGEPTDSGRPAEPRTAKPDTGDEDIRGDEDIGEAGDIGEDDVGDTGVVGDHHRGDGSEATTAKSADPDGAADRETVPGCVEASDPIDDHRERRPG